MEGVLAVGGGARSPSQYHQVTVEQGTEPSNDHRDELATHSGVTLDIQYICSRDSVAPSP